jgi:hypothetical protein
MPDHTHHALVRALVCFGARRRRRSFTHALPLASLALATLIASSASAAPKRYFLTVDAFPASQALGACGKGFHMAALWEIFDVTQLRYDTKRGQTRTDSGAGPAAGVRGWIRTGGVSGGADQVGIANCAAWTSDAGGNYGTVVELRSLWDGEALAVSPWEARTSTCDTAHPVWCRQN